MPQEQRVREGLAGLLEQPQPKFEAIKRHYRHGIFAMSRKSQCLVWVERDGEWRKAWEGMKGEGEWVVRGGGWLGGSGGRGGCSWEGEHGAEGEHAWHAAHVACTPIFMCKCTQWRASSRAAGLKQRHLTGHSLSGCLAGWLGVQGSVRRISPGTL